MNPLGRALFLSAVLAWTGCGGGASTPSAPSRAQQASLYDAIINQDYSGGWGVELAIYRNGVPVYVNGYGFRDRGMPDIFYGTNIWGTPQPDTLLNLPRVMAAPDVDTVFCLASLSKEFTAGAILLLQQDGALSISDPVSKYFPTLPSATGMTLLNLLQHSSGFVDYNTFGVYPDFTSAYQAFMASGQTNYQVVVSKLAAFQLDFTPGTKYEYSNTNYLLLGMIVAMVSGQPLGTFLQQRIFGPLGMTHTQQGYPPIGATDFALGYADLGMGPKRIYQWNLTWLAGPGGLTSTVSDIEKWDEAVRTPGIFNQTSLTQMFAPGPFPQPFGTYADGWIVSNLNGHVFIWHDGALGGYQTMNATFPNDGLDIIVLTNDGSGFAPANAVPALFGIATTAASRRRPPL